MLRILVHQQHAPAAGEPQADAGVRVAELGALAGGAQTREERFIGKAAVGGGEIGGARAEPGDAPDPQPLLGHPQPVRVHVHQ